MENEWALLPTHSQVLGMEPYDRMRKFSRYETEFTNALLRLRQECSGEGSAQSH